MVSTTIDGIQYTLNNIDKTATVARFCICLHHELTRICVPSSIYYKDELFGILDSRPETLFELNLGIIRFFIEKTGLAVDLRCTKDYTRNGMAVIGNGDTVNCDDLRETIHPKRPNSILKELDLEKPYFQVFSQKHGFQSDLSIMDLLFNEGPDSIIYLKKI